MDITCADAIAAYPPGGVLVGCRTRIVSSWMGRTMRDDGGGLWEGEKSWRLERDVVEIMTATAAVVWKADARNAGVQ